MAERSPAFPVVAGAEPFSLGAGRTGVVLLHGFTGNPSSLRPMGTWLADRGLAVACPRYPGHGTAWRELATTSWEDWVGEAERALEAMAARCDAVVVCGLSFGGAIALHLAARRPDAVRGVVAINPYLRDTRLVVAPLARFVIRSVKGVGNDIKKAGQDELPYDRIPASATFQLWRFFRTLRRELPAVRTPLLVFASREDHVVPRGSAEWLLRRVRTRDTRLVRLTDSYHVATLDNDAERIFEGTRAFVEALVDRPGDVPGTGAVTPRS